ncbi:metallophosphoesterase [Paenibacillus riograndensis]|uniref:Tat pathway signal sequence domain protein n=1 Tax=Paenibacillus riograndensis SBR5 TaxID=1073571 RepID=A0A0E4HD40_9BACL|nr:metallophosphoesterase [Paenibacillus riograndensis]CQR58006.1 Tat pathway signal sequence domain protein [Paenibacillus riograndensis SBR5]
MNKKSSGVSPDLPAAAAEGSYRYSTPPPQTGSGRKITRRQFLTRGAAALFGAGLLTSGYAWKGEPNWLDITRLELSFKELPSAFAGTRLVHFSDVHLGFNKDVHDLKRLAGHIKEAQPDIICFTGDIVDSYAEDLTESVPVLAGLSAPLGKYAILGNHDYKNTELLTRLLNEAGFRVLRNQSYLVKQGGASIAVTGLDDMLHGKPDPQAALKDVPEGMFTLLMMHEPDYADTVEAYPFHLQLSGHSHGGQIRLPFVGAAYTPYGSNKYISGLYYTDKKRMPVYVNRGFGETYMPFRLMCRPELTIFTLRRA